MRFINFCIFPSHYTTPPVPCFGLPTQKGGEHVPHNKVPLPDGQDQAGVEIKKLRRSITLLWICVILLNIDNLILSNRIDQIVGLLERFAKFSGIVTQVIEKLVYVLH